MLIGYVLIIIGNEKALVRNVPTSVSIHKVPIIMVKLNT